MTKRIKNPENSSVYGDIDKSAPFAHLLVYRKFNQRSPEWNASYRKYLDFIEERANAGLSFKDIGKELGISLNAVANVLYRRIWKDNKTQYRRNSEQRISLPPIPAPRS
jgi:YesN/AraC family two-component response regulator